MEGLPTDFGTVHACSSWSTHLVAIGPLFRTLITYTLILKEGHRQGVRTAALDLGAAALAAQELGGGAAEGADEGRCCGAGWGWGWGWVWG